nr:hypothetical protein [Tanacetum cinerariifolium]
MDFMEEGGPSPNLSSLKHFITAEEGPMTHEEAHLQFQEAKRLADLKATKDKSKEKLRRLTPAWLKAQEKVLTVIENERIKHLDRTRGEYLHRISFKNDQSPITKFNCKVSKTMKIATMRITRNNQPLNYKFFDDIKLKMLEFIKCLGLHNLASKRQNATNDQLLKNLKAKFKWVATIAEKLNIPPPPPLTDFQLPPTKSKRKRRAEIVKEVFISEDIMVDGMHKNLTLPQGVTSGTTG